MAAVAGKDSPASASADTIVDKRQASKAPGDPQGAPGDGMQRIFLPALRTAMGCQAGALKLTTSGQLVYRTDDALWRAPPARIPVRIVFRKSAEPVHARWVSAIDFPRATRASPAPSGSRAEQRQRSTLPAAQRMCRAASPRHEHFAGAGDITPDVSRQVQAKRVAKARGLWASHASA